MKRPPDFPNCFSATDEVNREHGYYLLKKGLNACPYCEKPCVFRLRGTVKFDDDSINTKYTIEDLLTGVKNIQDMLDHSSIQERDKYISIKKLLDVLSIIILREEN
jgi:hypothetical protein